jgi:hypothetical protein
VHHALADRVREPGLHHADRPAQHRRRDHAEHQQRQQRGVALRDGRVEHRAQEEWADDADAGRDADQHEENAEPPAVRHEQPPDPTQRHVRARRQGLPWRAPVQAPAVEPGHARRHHR